MMFFALGALSAALIALVIMPLVHARAVRLTTRRMAGMAPSSVMEVQAAKDQQRAAFAIATRKLELQLEEARSRVTPQQAEIGRAVMAAARAKTERDEAVAAQARAEATKAEAEERERVAEAALSETRLALEAARKAHESKSAEHASAASELSGVRVERDAARAEAAARLAHAEQLERARVALQNEVDTAKAARAATAEAERLEDAALREQIAQVAAEVIRLTAALESGEAWAVAEPSTESQPKTDGGAISLAERVRALQARAEARAASVAS
jgi:hypothetical protein